MAIAVTTYSNELNRVPPQSVTYSPLRPYEFHGRVRMAAFTVALLAQAQNSVIALHNIPKNARIIRGYIYVSAGPGANVNFDLGLIGSNGFIDDTAGATVADTAAFLGNFAPANAAAAGNYANTYAFNTMYVAKKALQLIATVKTAAVSVAGVLTGYTEYVVD